VTPKRAWAGAALSRADSDAERVEYLADVVRVHLGELETNRATALDWCGGLEDAEPVDGREPLERVGGERVLVCGGLCHADTVRG
jgi:hypothetical protein